MKTRIVRIGNSQGIRIPKPLLDQVGLTGEVVLTVEQGALVLRKEKQPREGWEKACKEMHANGDDQLIWGDVPSLTKFDDEEWEW